MCRNMKSSIANISVLPDEILTEIFTYLTVEERMAARWICRRWRNACNHVFIQKKEKLHIEGITHFKDIVPVLLATERAVLNLKFANHLFVASDNQSIWRHCGSRIQNLEFENCAMNVSSLEAMLANCTKLSVLSLYNVCIMNGRSAGSFSETFIQLKQRKVTASSVKQLIFNVQSVLTLPALSAMGSIFPNVKNVDFNFHPVKKDREYVASIMRIMSNNPTLPAKPKNNIYSCKKFIECLATGMQQLEQLTLNTLRECCECNKYLQETKFERLRTVKLYNKQDINTVKPEGLYFPREATFSTSPRVMNVTSIQFFENANAENVIKVLQKLPNLQEMKVVLTFATSFEEFTELYKAFANSKLVSLHLINELEEDWLESLPQILHDSSLPKNTTVRKLKIRNLREEDLWMAVFFKCFSAVEHLKLTIMDRNSQFTDIFRQRSLKCVELETEASVVPSNSLTGFFDKPVRFPELVENVQYLNVDIRILKELIIQKPDTFFSNLRFLHIAPRTSRNGLTLLYPLTQLELRCLPLYNLDGVYFNVDNYTDDLYTFFSRASNFPNIEYIGINIVSEKAYPTTEIAIFINWFKEWFLTCLNLRAVFLIVKDEGICLSYDNIRGEVGIFKPEQAIEGCCADSRNGISMFNYFRNLKSFREYWASHC